MQFRFDVFIDIDLISLFIVEFRAKKVDEINDQHCSSDRCDVFFIEYSMLFYVIENLLNFQVKLWFAFIF